MSDRELDNPFFSALCSRHRELARVAGEAARYPAEFAPFLGVASAEADVGEALRVLVQPGETWLCLGVVPPAPSGWRLQRFGDLAQMVLDAPLPVVDGPAMIELDATHRDDVLALTALVYPHYFRPRTMELGRYFGIYLDGRLAAMAGERLGTDGDTEVSAICTHPDFVGRGFARRLLATLSNDILAGGRRPFLHVSYENGHALALYQRIGYRLRRDIPFAALTR